MALMLILEPFFIFLLEKWNGICYSRNGSGKAQAVMSGHAALVGNVFL